MQPVHKILHMHSLHNGVDFYAPPCIIMRHVATTLGIAMHKYAITVNNNTVLCINIHGFSPLTYGYAKYRGWGKRLWREGATVLRYLRILRTV